MFRTLADPKHDERLTCITISSGEGLGLGKNMFWLVRLPEKGHQIDFDSETDQTFQIPVQYCFSLL
jgi:hypothetical protein